MKQNSKYKTLFILHYSPPIHGAAKVGDYVKSSKTLKDTFNCRFIKIGSSNNIKNIGKFSFLKVVYSVKLFFDVCYSLIFFRPSIVYYTLSPIGFAFYRDFVIVAAIKFYNIFRNCNFFFHYHSSGVKSFVSSSKITKMATNFLVKNSNIINISKFSKQDFNLLNGYSRQYILNNGVDDNIDENEFESIINSRLSKNPIKVFYLSNMMKGKGYDEVLNLALKIKNDYENKIEFNFAGPWESDKDANFFNDFVNNNNLENMVTYHGLVHGKQKHKLYKDAHFFIFTSKLSEVFPLVLLEALSYGLPILAFDRGGVSEIVTTDVGRLTSPENIEKDFNILLKDFLNISTYKVCRKNFLDAYQLHVFETNLKSILNGESIENYYN